MHTRWLRLTALVLSSLAPGQAVAQGTFPPDTLVNLRVLPADTPPRELIATMREMTIALGVRCQFCHVGKEGLPLDQFDFVSDAVDKKGTARAMLRLTRAINSQLEEMTAAAPDVTCYTCHRGARQPVHAAPKPAAGNHP